VGRKAARWDPKAQRQWAPILKGGGSWTNLKEVITQEAVPSEAAMRKMGVLCQDRPILGMCSIGKGQQGSKLGGGRKSRSNAILATEYSLGK